MTALKKVYVASGTGDAYVLRSLLESAGIESVIRGDDFVPLQGGSLLRMETRASVWVLQDETYSRALEVVEDYARRTAQDSPTVHETWICPGCGEAVECQFTECWNCGTERLE